MLTKKFFSVGLISAAFKFGVVKMPTEHVIYGSDQKCGRVGSFEKRIILPDRAFKLDFEEFIREASSVMDLNTIFYLGLCDKKFLWACGFSTTSKVISRNECVVVQEVESIIYTEVAEFNRFVRYDAFDQELLKYANEFDAKTTYPHSTKLISVSRIPKDFHAFIMEKIMEAETMEA